MSPNRSKAASLQFLLNNLKHPIFVYEGTTQQFSYRNAAFEQTFNLTPQRAIQLDILLQMVQAEDRPFVKRMYQLLLKQKNIEEIEFRLLVPG